MRDAAASRWLSTVATGLERLERESLEKAAAATPGERIERALALSTLVQRSANDVDKPLPVSLVALWRSRRRPV